MYLRVHSAMRELMLWRKRCSPVGARGCIATAVAGTKALQAFGTVVGKLVARLSSVNHTIAERPKFDPVRSRRVSARDGLSAWPA